MIQHIMTLFCLLSFPAIAQTNYKEFLKEVAKNKPSAVCLSSEYTVAELSFSNGKKAALCTSKNISAESGYVVYRFGKPGVIELEFPSDKSTWRSAFSISYYARGGGKANAAMEEYILMFHNRGYEYDWFQGWSSETDKEYRFISVSPPGKEPIELHANGNKGSLRALLRWEIVRRIAE